MKRPSLFVLALASPILGRAQEPVEPLPIDPPPAAVESITGREIAGHLKFLASDLLRGREAGTADARLAAEYLASHLTAVGAEPLGDARRGERSYFQRFVLEAATHHVEGSSLTLTIEGKGAKRRIDCNLGTDYIYSPTGIVDGDVEADALFVGDGRPEDYEGIDASNHFVLAYRGDPSADRARAAAARDKGALGLLLIASPDVPRSSAMDSPDARGFDRPRITLGPAPAETPTITLADTIRDVLSSSLGLSTPGASPSVRSGTVLRVRFIHKAWREPREDRNVIGFFPGSDPEKKKEIVVFSAHYDHEGVNEKGEIFNGSDDNASGTSGVMEIAEAFAVASRPARSLLFLWVSGEEKGLLGSRWYADHQNLPEGFKIVADINLDMISRNDPGKVGVTPSSSLPDYNTLVDDAVEIAKTEGLELQFDSDPYFARTDSFNFAAKGIPVIFFFAGLHDDYHKPTDDVEKADVEKAARIARAAFRLGWKTAQDSEPPRKTTAPTDDQP